MSNELPLGIENCSFLGTVLNSIRISLLYITENMLRLDTYWERFQVAEAIGLLITNDLTGGVWNITMSTNE